MSAFSTTLYAFCAGNIDLPQLLVALRDDLRYDRQALFDDTTLIESAWRAGRVDHEVYRVLRDTITGAGDFGSAESQLGVAAQPWPEIRARHGDWHPDETDQITTDEPTLLRASSGGGTAPNTGGHQHSSGAAGSTPLNRSWATDSPQWSNEPLKDVSPGAVLKERFVLEEVIGRGGMGTVYKARDIRKEEAQDRYPFVAVKVLNEDFRRHPESFKALQREAKKSQSLAHPNVASVFDFDRDGAVVFLVMELLEGYSLQTLIENRAGRGLPRPEVMRIIRSVGAALGYAHEKGVVHSDFKPANAIRTHEGAIKVLDFGIARAIAPPSHAQGETTRFNVQGLGAMTPAYASCEMLLGEQAHPSDDVFALACVTYELLSGRHPFGYLSALIAERQGLKPIPIEGLNRSSWRALSCALAFSRSERTASIQAFLDELAPKRRIGLVSTAIAAGVMAAGVGAWAYLPAFEGADPGALWSRLRSMTASEPSRQTLADQQLSRAPAAPLALPAAEEQRQDRAVSEQAMIAATPTSIVPAAPAAISTTTPSTAASATAESAPAELANSGQTIAEDAQIAVKEAGSPAASTEFSIDQLKQRLLAFSRIDEAPDALAILRELQARLPPEDEFLRRDAPQAIGEAYSRLGERAFTDGNYSAAAALLSRAHESAPEFPLFIQRRDQIQRVAQLEQMLEESADLSADTVQSRLLDIRESEGAEYALIRSRLAKTLARRIEALQKSAPAEANQLLLIGQQVFAGTLAIETLTPVDESNSAETTEAQATTRTSDAR